MHSARLAFLFLQRRIGADTVAWTGGLLSALLLRYDFDASRIDWPAFALIAAAAFVVQVIAGLATGLYLGRWRLGSFEEVSALARTVASVSSLLFLIELRQSHRFVPLSVVVGGGLVAFVLMGCARYLIRSYDEERRRPIGPDVRRLLVFGAGDAGAQIVASLMRDPASRYLPVALLDDDPTKRHLRIMGVPVIGDRSRMAQAADEHQADTMLVALPSASAMLIRELSDLAHSAGLDIKVLPGVGELVDGHVAAGDIRTPTAEDLLGRHPVDTDVASIAHYLRGKRVLVTGAGGSIGSELCRQIARFEPANLIMVDRDESALHAVQLSIEGRALLDSPDLVLLDLRDRDGLDRLFRRRRPEIIFHAAALKHLPLLERYPGEAVQSNVWVTAHILAAAADVGVAQFVNISTDKAADPISVLGYSKRIAERLTAHYAKNASGSYVSVRFGNVLGSRGSVLHAFRAQIEAGGPVTVTDQQVTRYFMTVHEAVQLVIQAAAVNGEPVSGDDAGTVTPQRHGEALVLDMGEPILLDDVARRLISESGRNIEIVYTGLRPGEKLHEDLFGRGEHVVRRVHPLISHVHVPPLDPDAVTTLDIRLPATALIWELQELSTVAMPPTTVPPVPSQGSPVIRRSPAIQSPRNGGQRRQVPADRPPRRRGLSLLAPLCGAAVKRAFDLVVAAAGLTLALPMLAVVAGLVRLRMSGPVLFRQCRLGRHAQSFKVVKFRTMSDERDAEGRLLPDEQRLTRLGRLLRTLSIDELPQLWNVLRGDMSLVGPRPLPVTYVRRYTPSEHRRHTVRPGLTGWAQVNGRNDAGWEERFALDVWYIEHRSFWLDLRILSRTVVALVRRDGISAQGEATMTELRPPATATAPTPTSAPDPAPATSPQPAAPASVETSRIWLSPPDVREPERVALLAALESGWVAPVGPDLDAFEAELAERCGVPHVLALSSGTAALHLALLQVGVAPGDDVLVPTATFAATANAVTYCGARPCFIDADPVTWQMSPALLAAELADRKQRGKLPAAVVTVDLYGACTDYDAILPLCAEYGVPVVEDAAEALGATFGGRPAGSFGAAGVLSFNGNKIITASSGGALLCHDGATADRTRYLASQARQPVAHYEHTEVGFNYRLSNLLAAFGRGQLATLDERIARRRAIQARYREAFADLAGIAFPAVDTRGTPNAWLTCITLEPGVAALRPEGLRIELEARNIETRALWKPMHAQPVFQGHPARIDGTADRLFATGLCLPSGSGLSDCDLDRVIDAVRSTLTKASAATRVPGVSLRLARA